MRAEDFKKMAETQKINRSAKYDYDSVERIFWKNVRFNPPTYGADMSGTFMDSSVTAWNCNNLNCILKVLGADLPGITSPYLYFGMWKAMFAWHVEDMNLFSINYIHFGEPKSWWAIPPSHGHRLEQLAQNLFPEQYQACPEFLRHKTTLISPQILKRNGIPITRAIQSEGEFIITFPYSFHCGFNHGYNCAESVNFALESWIEWGRKANCCNCREDIVKINMDIFVERYKYWVEHGVIPPLEEFIEPIPIPEREMSSNGDSSSVSGSSDISDSSLPKRKKNNTIETQGEEEEQEEEEEEEQEEEQEEEEQEEEEEYQPRESSISKRRLKTPQWMEQREVETTEIDKVEEPPMKQPRRISKRLNSTEIDILQDALNQSQGIPNRNLREQLATSLQWTSSGVYNWCRRELLRREKNQEERVVKPQSHVEKEKLEEEKEEEKIVSRSDAQVTTPEPEKQLKRPRPPRGTTPKKPKKYSLLKPSAVRQEYGHPYSHTQQVPQRNPFEEQIKPAPQPFYSPFPVGKSNPNMMIPRWIWNTMQPSYFSLQPKFQPGLIGFPPTQSGLPTSQPRYLFNPYQQGYPVPLINNGPTLPTFPQQQQQNPNNLSKS